MKEFSRKEIKNMFNDYLDGEIETLKRRKKQIQKRINRLSKFKLIVKEA